MPDYVIVGAGSAGCVLAGRLSEDANTSILLLEAGPRDTRTEIHIPAAFSKLFKTEVDWCYYTEDQPNLCGRKLYWPRGKMLGGCSSMNAMIWIRGNPQDYERWRELGAVGWCWDCVRTVFDRLEPLATHQRCVNPLSNAFIEACIERGIPRTSDFNGPEPYGCGPYRVTQKSGRRLSAAAAYLKPARNRKNLRIETGAHATKILFERDRAIGVEYVQQGSTHQVRANREVLLSGGAINSPQLLLLSGIGPAGDLQRLNIPVVADVPGVGQNLQDHLCLPVAYECTQPVSLANAESALNLIRYIAGGRGPLTSNVAEAGAFPREHPALQFHFGPGWFLEHGFRRPAGHGFTLGPTLIRPKSRGSIRLRNRNPFLAPAIDPRYLSESADRAGMLTGLALAREIAAAKAFDPFRGAEASPGAHIRSNEALNEYLENNLETLYHPVGTCKIGSDDLAVVDGYLQVRGVTALRVIDASVMPEITSGNTNAPTLMIAEKAATMLRASS